MPDKTPKKTEKILHIYRIPKNYVPNEARSITIYLGDAPEVGGNVPIFLGANTLTIEAGSTIHVYNQKLKKDGEIVKGWEMIKLQPDYLEPLRTYLANRGFREMQ